MRSFCSEELSIGFWNYSFKQDLPTYEHDVTSKTIDFKNITVVLNRVLRKWWTYKSQSKLAFLMFTMMSKFGDKFPVKGLWFVKDLCNGKIWFAPTFLLRNSYWQVELELTKNVLKSEKFRCRKQRVFEMLFSSMLIKYDFWKTKKLSKIEPISNGLLVHGKACRGWHFHPVESIIFGTAIK